MAKLKSELVIEATDKTSRTLRGISGEVDSFENRVSRATAELARSTALLTAFVAAASVPIRIAFDFESSLTDLKIIADQTDEQIDHIRKSVRKLGLETSQGAKAVQASLNFLVGAGLDPAVAEKILVPINRGATAYNASGEDLAKTSVAVMKNLKLTPEEIPMALDIVAKGSKEGNVEVPDLAAGLPKLTGSAQSLGMEGNPAVAALVAAVEVARGNTADASEATNNAFNFLSKVLSPEGIANFKEKGIDIVDELARATKAGADPLEHVLGILKTLTKGGKADLVAQLFGDQQAKNFLLALIPNLDEYVRIRDEALQSGGTVDKDFEIRSNSPEGKYERFQASLENLTIAIGETLLPKVIALVEKLTPAIDGLAEFIDANGELVGNVSTLVGELLAITVALRAAKLALLLAGGGGLIAGGAAAGGAAAAGAGATGSVVPFAGLLAWVRGALVVAAPAILADLATNQPGTVDEYDKQVAEQGKVREQLWDMLNAIGAWMRGPATGSGGGGWGGDDRSQAPTRGIADDWINADGAAAAGQEAGGEAGRGIALGLAAQTPNLAAQMRAIMDELRQVAAPGVHVPIYARTAGVPGVVPGLPARAAGGAVWPGQAFLVGELGPELVTFPANGMVHPAGVTASLPSMGAGGRSGRGGGPVTINLGGITLTNPTNADPQELSRLLGEEVSRRIRTHFSDGGI